MGRLHCHHRGEALCHDQALPANRLPRWPGVRVVPLRTLELQLVIHRHWAEVWDQRVLLPSERVKPLLHQELGTGVSGLERRSRAWQDPKVWLQQLQERPLALPVCLGLAALRGEGSATAGSLKVCASCIDLRPADPSAVAVLSQCCRSAVAVQHNRFR